MLALVGLSVLFGVLLYTLTGGREISDDAEALMYLSVHPWLLFEDWSAILRPKWGSFPPLLPYAFGALVRPWEWLRDDFMALRIGVISWSVLVMLGCAAVLARLERLPREATRDALWLYALLPSVWGSASFLPQEEIYVGAFGLLLYAAARLGAWRAMPLLVIVTALSAKYYALVLVLPVAFASPRPWRHAVAWSGVALATLAAYIAYQRTRHGLTPILEYEHGPQGGISLWSLLWELGVPAGPVPLSLLGVAGAGSSALLLSWQGRRRGVPLVFTMTAALYATVLLVVPSFTAYELWAVPLAIVAFARMRDPRPRRALVALLFGWAAGTWGVNFCRGVALALRRERDAGKAAFADRVEGLVGADFPFAELQVACLALVLLCGVGLIAVLWRAGRALGEASTPAPS